MGDNEKRSVRFAVAMSITDEQDQPWSQVERQNEDVDDINIGDMGGCSVVRRFSSTWPSIRENYGRIQAIQFKANKDIEMQGIGVYTGKGQNIARAQLFKVSTIFINNEDTATEIASTNYETFDCASKTISRITFGKPVHIRANEWYIITATIDGDKSEWGRHGEDHAVADGVAFEFRDSKLSKCTYVERGQIPEIYFEVPGKQKLQLRGKKEQAEMQTRPSEINKEMSIKEEPEQRWAEVKKQIEADERRKLDEIRERVRKKLELEERSEVDLEDAVAKREETQQKGEQKNAQKGYYTYEAEVWRSRVSGLKSQIIQNNPYSYFLFERMQKNMPALEDQLFSFVDKFSESERLHAGKDLQFGELRTLWKEFKAEVEALEQRLTQCVDLESEDLYEDTCTYDNSGDEAESTIGTELSDSESQIQRTTDYARDAVEFRCRVDLIMEEISEHPTSASTEISLRKIAQIKGVDLPALATILGRLMNVHASCDDGELQWNVLKTEWTRLRDAIDARCNELKEIQQNVAKYFRESDDFKSKVDKIMAYLTSTTYVDDNEALADIQQIKREDLPHLESCLDRLLDLLVKGKYEGLQKGLQFDELVQEWQRLSDIVRTRECLLLENLSRPRFIEEDCEDDSIISEEDSKQPVDQICRKTPPERLSAYVEEAKDFQWRIRDINEQIASFTSDDYSQALLIIERINRVQLPHLSKSFSRLEKLFPLCYLVPTGLWPEMLKPEWILMREALEDVEAQARSLKGVDQKSEVRQGEEQVDQGKQAATAGKDVREARKKSRPSDINDMEEELRCLEVEGMRVRLEKGNKKNEEEAISKRVEENNAKNEQDSRMIQFDEMRERWKDTERMRQIEMEIEEELLKKLEEERRKRIEEGKRKKEAEEMKMLAEEKRRKEKEQLTQIFEDNERKRIEEEKEQRLEEEKRKKEETEKKKIEEEEVKKRFEEEKKKDEILRMQNQDIERQKEDERRAVLERVRRENRKSEAERLEATLRAHDRQTEELRRERDEDERRAVLERARRENKKWEAERAAATRGVQERLAAPMASPTNQRKEELEKRLKEMENQNQRLAAEMAALKREFGLDAAGNDRAGSVGASLRRTVSEEERSPPQHPASTSPVEAGPPAAPLDDQRSNLLAAISERRALNRTASRPRSVTFGDAQEQMDIVAELNRSPSFIRRKAAHASDNKSES